MYYKRCSGCLLVKSIPESLSWVQWTHHAEGKTHCEECLKLDGCWFLEGNALPCPHHPFCHCTLEPIEYATVLQNTSAHSAYSKFDPWRIWRAIITPGTCYYCASMNGRILSVNDPRIEGIPVHENCRCYVEAVTAIAAGTATNAGAEGVDLYVAIHGSLPAEYLILILNKND